MVALIESALHERQVEAGAKFAEFGGWSMPLEYAGGGVVAEHTAVREGVGVFDVSHLGTLEVTGPDAVGKLNRIFTNDLAKIGPGQAQYTLLCLPSGGVIDDLIVYIRSPTDVLLIPNAANSAAVADVVRVRSDLAVTDRHRDVAVLAVQGPRSASVLDSIGLVSDMPYMSFIESIDSGVDVVVCRTGYTGEHGYELLVTADVVGGVWDRIVECGARPCGLGARDTLRTEMGYPLHGHELGLDINAVEAGAAWAVGWDKPDFIGRDSLLAERAQGPMRRARGLLAKERAIPRQGMAVSVATDLVGLVTSGTFSPSLRQGIALALLNTSVTVGDQVEVDIRGRPAHFEVVKPPFIERRTR